MRRGVPLFGSEGVDQLSSSLSQAHIEPVKRGAKYHRPSSLIPATHKTTSRLKANLPTAPHSVALEILLPAESRVARPSRAGGASPTSTAISTDTGLCEVRKHEEEIS